MKKGTKPKPCKIYKDLTVEINTYADGSPGGTVAIGKFFLYPDEAKKLNQYLSKYLEWYKRVGES